MFDLPSSPTNNAKHMRTHTQKQNAVQKLVKFHYHVECQYICNVIAIGVVVPDRVKIRYSVLDIFILLASF